jgi:hypothetical protein
MQLRLQHRKQYGSGSTTYCRDGAYLRSEVVVRSILADSWVLRKVHIAALRSRRASKLVPKRIFQLNVKQSNEWLSQSYEQDDTGAAATLQTLVSCSYIALPHRSSYQLTQALARSCL